MERAYERKELPQEHAVKIKGAWAKVASEGAQWVSVILRSGSFCHIVSIIFIIFMSTLRSLFVQIDNHENDHFRKTGSTHAETRVAQSKVLACALSAWPGILYSHITLQDKHVSHDIIE